MVANQPLVAPLFVPANKPDRFAKAAASGADALIVDLEDAVPVHDKASARAQLAGGLRNLTTPVFLRINAHGTPWFASDVRLAATLPIAGVMLPKSEMPEQVEELNHCLAARLPVVALIETALGVANLSRITSARGLHQLAFGSIDYALDLNCSQDRAALAHARSELVFRSRVAGLAAPLDGVTANLSEPAVLVDDCSHAASLGFGGKLAIHPKQIAAIRVGFEPSSDTLDWAKRVVKAETDARGAPVLVDGQMVDRPVSERARRILAAKG